MSFRLDRDCICNSYCMCLGMDLSKSQFANLEKKLKQAKLDKLKAKARIDVSLATSRTRKNLKGLIVRMLTTNKGVDEKDLRKIFPLFQKAVSIPERLGIKKFNGISCISVMF